MCNRSHTTSYAPLLCLQVCPLFASLTAAAAITTTRQVLCDDEFECVRVAAVHALEKLAALCSERITRLLVRLLTDSSPDVRQVGAAAAAAAAGIQLVSVSMSV